MPSRKTSTSYGEPKGNRRGHGRGPAKGATNAGRPTQSFKHFVNNLRQSAKAQKAFQEAVEDSRSRNFGAAWKILTEYDDEKPAKRVAVDVSRLKEMTDAELEAIASGRAMR